MIFIPFRNAGNGIVHISKILLDQMYEASLRDPNEKVLAGILVKVPDFPDEDRCPFDGWEKKLDDYWQAEIGSFIEALRKIGYSIRKIVCPSWYKKLNWNDLKTICTTSTIDHKTYISDCPDVEFQWHAESLELQQFGL